ncbi:MAG: hypothetical protein ABI808_06980 [Pseudonocardiales bacterium]
MRGLSALAWFVVLGGIAPLIVIASAPLEPTLLICGAVVAHCAAALAAVLTSRRIQPMQFGFWAFAYLFLGLAPLAQVSRATYPTGTDFLPDISVVAIAIVELGLLAFSFGMWLAGNRPPPVHSRLESLFTARALSQTGVVVAIVVSVLLFVVLLPHFGGLGTFFASRQASNQAVAAYQSSSENSTATGALINWGLSIPPLWALLGLLALRPGLSSGSSDAVGPTRRMRRLGRLFALVRHLPIWFWTGIVVAVTLNVIVNNPISQPRFWAGTVLLSLIFRARRLRRPTVFRFAAASILFLLLVVFPYSDYFRYQKTESVAVTSLSQQLVDNNDYDAFVQIEAGVDYINRFGFSPKAGLGPVFFWVPRSVWHGKPSETGGVLSRDNGYTLTNRSAPMWIEAYLWGGVGVVVVWFALIGYLERRLDDIYDAARDRDGLLIHSVVPVFAFFQLIVLRGSLLQATGPFVMLLVIPLLMSRRVAIVDAAARARKHR